MHMTTSAAQARKGCRRAAVVTRYSTVLREKLEFGQVDTKIPTMSLAGATQCELLSSAEGFRGEFVGALCASAACCPLLVRFERAERATGNSWCG